MRSINRFSHGLAVRRPLGSAGPGSAGLGSARLDRARLGSARLGSAGPGSLAGQYFHDVEDVESVGTGSATARQWIERDAAVLWHGFTQMATFPSSEPIVVERAEGRELIDVDGRRYLDAISSLWVTTLGHRVPELDAALARQIRRVAHSTMLGNSNTVVVELAEALAEIVPVNQPHFLFASDGASAVEQALKIALQYWVNRGATERSGYLVLGNAYHGDTVGSLSLGDSGFGTGIFDPLRFEVLRTPGYGDPGWLDSALDCLIRNADRLAAVVIEPLVQGAAGMLVADPRDVAAFAKACSDEGVLLVADEVATGFGRTGKMFASDICGLHPDLLCLGKGITGGYLPMSATVAAHHVYSAFLDDHISQRTFFHGHSYGGNALAAAVALEHLRIMERDMVLANVTARGAQLGDLLEHSVAPLEAVSDVRRCGLMAGVELAADTGRLNAARRVCAAAVRRGVLLRPLGDVVVLMPPLTTTADEIERIVTVLTHSIEEVAGSEPDAMHAHSRERA
ncbi:MAG: adenosylmethionine--8-amino-7-oxononanoate transaminase [Acidimicrobiales bacterium]